MKLLCYRIGLAIARRLGQDGAKVMVSSRKQTNVERTVEQLKAENLNVEGMVCHVGKSEHRSNLIKEVGIGAHISQTVVFRGFSALL